MSDMAICLTEDAAIPLGTEQVTPENITVLFCHPSLRLTKRFTIKGEEVSEEGYNKAKFFQHRVLNAGNLDELFRLLQSLAGVRNACLIRGMPADRLGSWVERNGQNFPMPEGGVPWVCLDFDSVDLPHDMDPYSREAVEHAVRRLPSEFHNASYIGQFSASAGILKPDGAPHKPGLRAHVFFWLERGVTNEELKTWLRGNPVDASLFGAVQAHYIADPELGQGVRCALNERLFLARKAKDAVAVPEFAVTPGPRYTADDRNAEWTDPKDGLPSFDDLLTCEFIDWYITHPHPQGERYEQTRAFAHNLRRVDSNDWEELFLQYVPGDFPYAEVILKSAANGRPHTCRHIYDNAYRCPKFDPTTGTCRINRHSKTPYGLARWMKGEK